MFKLTDTLQATFSKQTTQHTPGFSATDYIGLSVGDIGLIQQAKTNFQEDINDTSLLVDGLPHKKTTSVTEAGEITVYGIHVDEQEMSTSAQATQHIFTDINQRQHTELSGTVIVVGTCFEASAIGTAVGETWLKHIVDSEEHRNKIITSGFMDFKQQDEHGNWRRGVNGQVANLIDSDPSQYAHRLLTLWNDGATLWDTRGHGERAAFPAHVQNALFVYSDARTEIKGEAMGFGRDSVEFVSRALTTNAAGELVSNDAVLICMGGGLQSLAEMFRAIRFNIPVKSLEGLKDPNEPVMWEGREIQLFSATTFISRLKEALSTKRQTDQDAELTPIEVARTLCNYLHTDEDTINLINRLVPELNQEYQPYDDNKCLPAYPRAHDIESKPEQLISLITQLFEHELFTSQFLNLINVDNVNDLAIEYGIELKTELSLTDRGCTMS